MVNIDQKPQRLPGRRIVIAGAALVAVVVAMLALQSVLFQSGPPNIGAMEKFTPIVPPRPVPDVAFISPDGAPIKLADKGGRVLLVNFWATWCAPCIRELPALAALQRKLDAKTSEVVLISVDRQGTKDPAAFLRQLGLNDLRSALDPTNALVRAFAAKGLPVTYLIDAEGKIQGQVVGDADWDSAEAVDLVHYYLAPKN